ncbi:DUF397 domain-containing protein [Streptomyces sp. WAC 06738]|nr:DUF397 domain-containing protein [Streptomyces sp. WAC 06738]
MTNTDASSVRLHNSSHRSTYGGEGVEVGGGFPVVPVRDGRHPCGPVLVFFVAGALNRGGLDA